MNIKRLDRTKIITSSFKSYLNSFPSILTYELVLESTRLFLNKLIFTPSLHRKKKNDSQIRIISELPPKRCWPGEKERKGGDESTRDEF